MKQYTTIILVIFLFLVSFFSFLYFFENEMHLASGDAVSRMNISRKIVDNLTPGLAQLGNVWLPLPQLLMLPFLSNYFLWQTGIGGAIVSMSAYVVAGLFIYKAAKLLTNSTISGLVAVGVFSLNINVIYLQTTAMSEMLFLCFLAAAIYYFSKWIKFEDKMHLIPAAICVSCLTLIRYEALAILLSSIPMVFAYTYLRSRKYHKAESNTIMYSVLACLGFGLWTIYLAAIFGDPLYWKNYYAGAQVSQEGAEQIKTFVFQLSYVQAFWKYFTAVVWMNGLIPTAIALIGIPILFFKSVKEKSFYFLPVLLSLSVFAFMTLTLKRNTPINQPELSMLNFMSPSTSVFNEFNIRYGILMLPMIALLCSYFFNIRFIVTKILIILLMFVQFYTYFSPDFTVIYQYPIRINGGFEQKKPEKDGIVAWIQQNYDDGLIMISAQKHDPQMFRIGLDYKYYIHEGTGRYWKESIIHPQKYAKWIVMDPTNQGDQVTKFIGNSPSVAEYYDEVYTSGGTVIYRIKTKTDVPFQTLIN